MDLEINACVVHGFTIDIFPIRVTSKNYILVRKKLEEQNDKIVKILKKLKENNEIKSVYIPKNKKIQEKLNKLVITKKLIKKAINQIKQVFYK